MTTPTPDYDFHPLADNFPMIEKDELRELANDIQRLGLREPIVLFEGKILDGRNRYRAAKAIKYPLTDANFKPLPSGVDPLAFVISANIHRRHLTPEQRRGIIATLLKADPTQSNRRIADTAKVSHVTVGDVRSELETTGQLDQLPSTTGADGKSRKRKPKVKGKGSGGDKEKITYQKVVNAKTALNAYSVLEEHLLDALRSGEKCSMKCQNCGRFVIPHLSSQRFCSRACSDEWHQCERREAVEWYRACGMRPTPLHSDEEQVA